MVKMTLLIPTCMSKRQSLCYSMKGNKVRPQEKRNKKLIKKSRSNCLICTISILKVKLLGLYGDTLIERKGKMALMMTIRIVMGKRVMKQEMMSKHRNLRWK